MLIAADPDAGASGALLGFGASALSRGLGPSFEVQRGTRAVLHILYQTRLD